MHPDNPWGITGAIKGMIQVKKANPSFYIAVAWRGEESIEPATQVGLPDLLLIESYTHLARKHKKSMGIGMPGIKKRIDAARKLGAIDRTICWLGHIRKAGVGPENYHEGHVLTADMVEQQVAELRRYAPEMPGIAFYRNDDPELSGACDRVCRKYFVDAAPNVRLTRPHFQQVITSAHVEAVVGENMAEEPFDVAICDPPRAGIHPDGLAALCRMRIPRLVYVSCNVKQLPLDLEALTLAGYRITAVRAFDMSPHTPHIETVVRLDLG